MSGINMFLYNTLTGELEPFEAQGRRVNIYTCGITPYDTTHLGHAFTYAVSDMLIRYLEWLGFPVTYVQNVTDVDDDILRKASEMGEDWRILGDRWTAHFIRDMQQLNVRSPDYYPRATDVIPEMQETVQKLLAAGLAYENSGNVYFDIHSWQDYGKLSKLDADEMLEIANQRGNFPDDPYKRSPLDFVLWQAHAPGEPSWDSPWGPGRPGWHIECSIMSTKWLGETIDIHLGGDDLVFPHHECEIAQIEPLTGGKPFVRYWMHTAMVHHQGEKMSKSLENLVMVSDLLREMSPDAIRIYLAMHHYRKPWSHNQEELAEALELAKKTRFAMHLEGGSGPVLDPLPWRKRFDQAMANDLDTPSALQAMSDLVDAVNESAAGQNDLSAAQLLLKEMSAVFGLSREENIPDPEVIAGWNRHLQRFDRIEFDHTE